MIIDELFLMHHKDEYAMAGQWQKVQFKNLDFAPGR